MMVKKVSKEKREELEAKTKGNRTLNHPKYVKNTLSLNDLHLIIQVLWELKEDDTSISEYNNWLYCEAERLVYKKYQFGFPSRADFENKIIEDVKDQMEKTNIELEEPLIELKPAPGRCCPEFDCLLGGWDGFTCRG